MRRLAALALPLALCITSSARAAEADPLAELAKLGDSVAETAQEGGGSIRAKKDVDLSRDKRLKDPRNVEAKVESSKTGTFPAVALKLKVLKPAKEGPGKDLKANEIIVVTPKLKADGGKIALTDNETVLNSGSYYLVDGDKVMVRLGEKTGKVWQAEYIERK